MEDPEWIKDSDELGHRSMYERFKEKMRRPRYINGRLVGSQDERTIHAIILSCIYAMEIQPHQLFVSI